ncbi:hypothetical protein [Williamsia sp.]|uniref:hypothetical protein n=1 Tax=Williamsia sp. TaxID=1872085 RepID=UPI001A1B5EA9|nr:hypothetical protein [Williamsia sp.]MBJ7288532.1 hypothetical protein [Williamsia sp.]
MTMYPPHGRPRRGPVVLAALVVVAVVAAGVGLAVFWSPQVSGSAVPIAEKPGFVTVDGSPVAFRDLPRIAQATFIRSTDPCGFITPEQLRAIGSPATLEPDSINTCQASINVGQKYDADVYISFAVRPPDEDSSNSKFFTETMSDQAVVFEDGSLDCTASIEIQPPADPRFTARGDTPGITRPATAVWLQIKRSTSDASRPGCDLTRKLAAPAAKTVSSKQFPVRKQGPQVAPIVGRDPCAITRKLPAGTSMTAWQPSNDTGVNKCALTLGTEKSPVAVNVVYALRTEGGMASDREGLTASDIGGRTVFSQEQNGGCVFTTTAGKATSFAGGGSTEPTLYYPIVVVGGPCDTARQLLPIVATLAEK